MREQCINLRVYISLLQPEVSGDSPILRVANHALFSFFPLSLFYFFFFFYSSDLSMVLFFLFRSFSLDFSYIPTGQPRYSPTKPRKHGNGWGRGPPKHEVSEVKRECDSIQPGRCRDAPSNSKSMDPTENCTMIGKLWWNQSTKSWLSSTL